MIGALILGLALGAVFAAVGIAWRWWTGQPTVVTGGGWATGPLQTGGWGLLIGSIVALLEVLISGKRLSETWGVRIVLSAVGGMVGGLLAWRLYVAVTAPTVGAPATVQSAGQDANKMQGGA